MIEHDPSERTIASRIARLTRGQRACLLLVAEHLSSKEIARELGVSPHTVDQRIRVALRTLGVHSRVQACRLLLDDIQTQQQTRAVLPFSTIRHQHNTMDVRMRLLWIAIISAGAALVTGLGLAALESLAQLFELR
jgi:DNA-binding CsgD family transcriptional regulator